MLSNQERDAIFASVDLRRLTGQPVPSRRNKAVRVDCPVHGGEGDLAVFPDHAFCFSAKCGWSGRAFDTAAILLGYYDKSDPMWANRNFHKIMSALRQLSTNSLTVPEEVVVPPTENEMRDTLAHFRQSGMIEQVDKWRGWPMGTAMNYGLVLGTRAIAIPVFRSDGKLMTIRYRIRPSLEEKGRPKYWGTAGANEENILFGGHTQPHSKGIAVVLVEGEFDTISSQLAGVPTLAFINGAGWKEGRERVLRKLLDRFQHVLVAYDQDEGGTNGLHGYDTVRGTHVPGIMDMVDGIIPVHWDPDQGKDPGEFIKKQGADTWRTLLRNHLRPARQSSSRKTDADVSRFFSWQTAA